MGSTEEVKPEKSSSPPLAPQEQQNNVHVYPDWAAMQAYYGPRVALPPYYNSAVPSGHPPPPYMWGPPQVVMPPYGPGYAAIYPHGGAYAHPGVTMGSQSVATGVPSSSPNVTDTMAGTPLSMDMAEKKPENTDLGSVKKLKGMDGLVMTIGNGSSEKAEGSAENRLSRSSESDGSSDDSEGNTTGTDDNKRKRSYEVVPTAEKQTNPLPVASGQLSSAADKVLGVPVTPPNGAIKGTTFELSSSGRNGNAAPLSKAAISSDTWIQNERELKRERRKQSNRESARRSRLRKQAETEELAKRVDSLNAENMALKSEINQLVGNSEKLRQENAKLMEKLKNSEVDQAAEDVELRNGGPPKRSTKNLIESLNNNDSRRSSGEDNSGAKFHHSLGASRRPDAVAAG